MNSNFAFPVLRWRILLICLMLLLWISLSLTISYAGGLEEGNSDSTLCSELEEFLNGFMYKGHINSTILSKSNNDTLITEFRDEYGQGHPRQIHITDIDNDGDYEIIYIAYKTDPRIVETMIYYLMDISLEEANSLIENGKESQYYKTISEKIWNQYIYESMGLLVDLKPIKIDYPTLLYIEMEKNPDITFCATILAYKQKTYLLVEELPSPVVSLDVISVIDIGKELFEFECGFSVDKTNNTIEVR